MQSKQSGFTIVELVVVIILLGILAATALPRFIDIDEEAHDSVAAAMQGALQTGVSMFHAKWIAQGQPAAGATFAEFGAVASNAGGYPRVTGAADCVTAFQDLLQAGAPSVATLAVAANLDDGTWTGEDFAAVVNGTNCEFYHAGHSTTNGDIIGMLTYDSTTGEVTLADYTII